MSLSFSIFAIDPDHPDVSPSGEAHWHRVCDTCEQFMWKTRILVRTGGKQDFDFCSLRCLAAWSTEMAEYEAQHPADQ